MPLRRPGRVLAILGALVLVCLVLHIAVGSYENLSVSQILHELARGPGFPTESSNSIVWQIRMPRALVCILVGSLLGVVGSTFQALLKNPLADPYIVGVSSGSAVGGALAVVLGVGGWFGNLGIAGAGFVTGLLTLAVVYRLSLRKGVVDVRTLLLAGVVIGSLLSSLVSMVLLMGGKDQTVVLSWLLGNTSDASWPQVGLLVVALVIGFGLLAVETKRLNAFALGEDVAHRLGVDVRRLTRIVLVTGGAMTAAAVGTVGIIGFVGLAAPHIARRLVGVDWRVSMPGSMLVGALLLIASDAIAQRFFSLVMKTPGMELPVGIVTSVLGAPSLIILLRKSK